MSSRTQIANLALIKIGVSKQISNVDTDTSREAITIRTLMDQEIAFVLRDFPWPFATAYETLALVAGTSTVPANNDWQYSYRYPSDCMFARRIVVPSVGRRDPNPPPFRIGRDSQGRLLYTNIEDAELEYTARIDDSEEFDSIFVGALSWKLAAGAAPPLSRIKGIIEVCLNGYEYEKTQARSRALNEQQQEEPLESEFMRARE